jgi:hypothetical protein
MRRDTSCEYWQTAWKADREKIEREKERIGDRTRGEEGQLATIWQKLTMYYISSFLLFPLLTAEFSALCTTIPCIIS